MKFNFNLKGRKEAGIRYEYIHSKMQTQDLQGDLYTALLKLFPEGAWYLQPQEDLRYTRELIKNNDPAFVAKLAAYLREELLLPELAFVLSAELVVHHASAPWVRNMIDHVIRDVVEVPVWLNHYLKAAGVSNTAGAGNMTGTGNIAGKKLRLPTRLRKNLGPLFNKLDEYHFSRYTQEDQDRLKAALTWVRPSAENKKQKQLFEKILHGDIQAKTSWSAEYKQLQAQSYDSLELKQSILRDKWKEGISSFRIGYLGLLDNLQPMISAGVSGKALKLAAEYIGHPAAVASTNPSPLSLLSAYRKLKGRREGGVPLLLESLEKAADYSASLLGIDEHENIVLAMDVSNSMKQKLHEGGCIQRYDVGPLLAFMLKDRTRSLTAGIIGNTWKPIDLKAPGILAGVDPFHRREGEAGYAINAHLVILDLLKKGKIVDKVMIFTDSNGWDDRPLHQPEVPDLVRAWQLYRSIAPNASLYLFNLAGYNQQPLEVKDQGVYQISGWHDRIFEVLQAIEKKDSNIESVL